MGCTVQVPRVMMPERAFGADDDLRRDRATHPAVSLVDLAAPVDEGEAADPRPRSFRYLVESWPAERAANQPPNVEHMIDDGKDHGPAAVAGSCSTCSPMAPASNVAEPDSASSATSLCMRFTSTTNPPRTAACRRTLPSRRRTARWACLRVPPCARSRLCLFRRAWLHYRVGRMGAVSPPETPMRPCGQQIARRRLLVGRRSGHLARESERAAH